MKRFAYLKKDYINKYFCHELFHDVFILLPWSDIKQASIVCRLWHDHIQQMRNTLFRSYYDRLGGNSTERRDKVTDWEVEVMMLQREFKTDLQWFKYSIKVGDDALYRSVVEDGGLVMEVCNSIIESGGRVAVAELLIKFQKQVSTQTQKSEIVDIIDFMCDTLNCSDGDDGDDEEVVFVCLKEFLEHGKFIKAVRNLFLWEEQVDGNKLYEWINKLCEDKKYPDTMKKEIYEFLEILTDRIDDEFCYSLRKAYSTKRLL